MPSEWGSMIKQEIIDLKLRMTALEAHIKELGIEGAEEKEYAGRSIKTPKTPLTEEDIKVGGTYKLSELKALGFENEKDILASTYALQSAIIAARGYLMLIDQLGLSKDQKAMVRELEYSMMAAMKAMQAINSAMAISTFFAEGGVLNPIAIFNLGGYTASTIAYAYKATGGNV